MSVDQDLWRRAEDIFHAALDRSQDQRQTFVDQSCRGHPDLRHLVETLLQNDLKHPSFLQEPAVVLESLRPAQDLTGRRVGAYRILSLLGAGGMGEVYRAHDEHLGRDVAIKMLPPAFAGDPWRLARFHREARVLASLNHPNIAAIYSLDETADGLYLVLELVEGDRLRGPLPIAETVDLASQVAAALEAAHQHGIVHRDLKPGNVKLTPDGRVKVLDFGLAKAIAGSEPVLAFSGTEPFATGDGTVTGNVLGTPGYMSPEQARGEAVDQRTDIWAFGCLVYELLTGRRAFDGAPGADAATVLEQEPDWRVLPEGTPGRLRELLKQCLQKDRDQRVSAMSQAGRVLRELRRAYPRRAPGRPEARSIDAYELCLRARYHHQKRTQEGFAKALSLFEQAIQRDPECALAHAGIAHVCLIACYFGGIPTIPGMSRMKAAAERAVELDDTLAVGHVRLADALCFKDWDWAGAEREFQRALALDPESPEALSRYGLFLWARMRHEEALVRLQQALELDPLSLDTNWFLGWAYVSLGRLDDAATTAARLIAMAPEAWLGHHIAAQVHWRQRLWAQAVADCEKAAAAEGGPAMLALLCAASARAGRTTDANRCMEGLRQMATHRIVPPTWMAVACDALGADEEARACMERAFRERHMALVHLRGWSAALDEWTSYLALLDAHGL